MVLDAEGFPAHCAVGLQTQQVVRLLSQPQQLDVAAGDVVVVTTQLWDSDMRSITTESKRGYDSRDLGRPERMGYDPRKLVEKLHDRGAIIAYGRLTAHPELALNVAASRQKHKTLTNFFVRFEMTKETNGVRFFDLFEGVDQSHFQSDESVSRADELGLGPKSLKKHRWVPGSQAQLPMAQNIWRAVEALLLAPDGSVAPSGPAENATESFTTAALSTSPGGLTAADGRLSLLLTPLGVNEASQVPLEDGAHVAVAAIMEFLRGTARVIAAGGLRLLLYTGSATNLAAFEAALASVGVRDARLVLSASSITEMIERPCAPAGEPVSAFVHEIDRRGRGLLKGASRLLEEATAVSAHPGDSEGAQLGLHARIKEAVTSSNQQLSTVAEQSTAYTISLAPGQRPASVAIAVRPPSMNADRQGLDRADALVELRHSWRAVLAAFAAHAGLAED